MKLATWNVNGIRSVLTKGALQTYLTSAQPDILYLQETKAQPEQIDYDFAALGYQTYWNSAVKKGYSGTGLLTKVQPLNVTFDLGIEEHDQEGRVICAEFEHYYYVGAYVPNAKRDLSRLAYRERWEDDFVAYLDRLAEHKPVIYTGDLNVAPQAIDLANPTANTKNAGFTLEERSKFAQLLAHGYVDAFRALYPDQTGAYTWWSYMNKARERNIGWRIDHFVVSPSIVPLIEEVKIRPDMLGSDHCPVELYLNV